MKSVQSSTEPLNILIGKDRAKGLYEVLFDHRQTSPRVSVGSAWVGHDRRNDQRYLFRVVELGYNSDFDLKMAVENIRYNPEQPFDERSLEYYCSEKAWMRLEGEFVSGALVNTGDQPTILQTYVTKTTATDEALIAAPDPQNGFYVGQLRSGWHTLPVEVTIPDRFCGYRTIITGVSGYGKSTLVRNICRHWLSQTKYGKLIDDLKCEYIDDVPNEMGQTVPGLCHHPDARTNLYLFTPRSAKYPDPTLSGKVAGIHRLVFRLDDIPPHVLQTVATHLTPPQQLFLDMYHDSPGLFRFLMRRNSRGDIDTSGWYQRFRGFIVLTKEGKARYDNHPTLQEDESAVLAPSEIAPSSYLPIHGVIKQLERLTRTRYVDAANKQSCLDQITGLLRQGKTVLIDKSGLTDEDRIIISTVIANRLYSHNEGYSSGSQADQAHVIPFTYLVEEAHLLLSKERVRDGSIFVNFAKTGRSFQIGLVTVTQRPSSIDDNILSQCDNFITLRLTFGDDVRDLIKASGGAFAGYESDIAGLDRGAAVVAFGEPRRVQSVKFYDWNLDRAKNPPTARPKGPETSSPPVDGALGDRRGPARSHLWSVSEEE